jgi:uncharacterized protein (DUF1697 family)
MVVALLRGVNIGPRNRIAMSALREALANEGLPARTYVQSGNLILDSDLPADALAASVRRLIATEFGLEIDVLARTRQELAAVVARNPLGDVASDPRRYQVSFLAAELDGEVLARLQRIAAGSERLLAAGRELYAWHPEGIARSKLWAALAGRGLGVSATARNWTTVSALLALCDE